MLDLVLNDLMRERENLCNALRAVEVTNERTDFVDCWNLLDEIDEYDRRIATLKRFLASEADNDKVTLTSDSPSRHSSAPANLGERYVVGRRTVHSAVVRSAKARQRLPLAGRR